MKILLLLPFFAVIVWACWRIHCAIEPHLRGFHRTIDEHVDPHLKRIGLGRLVEVKNDLGRAVEGAVDETNARAKARRAS